MSNAPSAMEVSTTTTTTTPATATGGTCTVMTKKRSFLETEAAESLLRQHQHSKATSSSSTTATTSSASSSSSSPFAVASFYSPWANSTSHATAATPPATMTTSTTTPTQGPTRSSRIGSSGGVLQAENRSIPHKKRRQHPRPHGVDSVEGGVGVKVSQRPQMTKQHQPSPPDATMSVTLATAATPPPSVAAALTLRKLPVTGGGGAAPTGSGPNTMGTATVDTPVVVAVTKVKSPKASSSGSGSNSSTNGSHSDAAWMHRLYPFDGPTIEEFTPLFQGVNIDDLVDQKLAAMPDKFLATVVKGYYDKVTQLDHNQYKDAVRPPVNIPEGVRPFLLSRHQLKSFNSDYLRSALRKTKVNKTFCQLLRGDTIKGVPMDLRNLGNEAFARSIRTHQIIAYFTRYHSLFVTKRPGHVLDLNDPEHKILLDCLRDIVRRVSAKKAIQQPVVDSLPPAAVVTTTKTTGPHPHVHVSVPALAYNNSFAPMGIGGNTPRAPVTATGDDELHGVAAVGVDRESLLPQLPPHDPDKDAASHQGTLETANSTLADEKENQDTGAGDSTSPQPMDGSFDSSFASTAETSFADDSSTSSPGPILSTPMCFGGTHFTMTPRDSLSGSGRDSFVAYQNVLSMLSDEARRSVEDMVSSMRHKVWEEARHMVCQRSYEEGRRVGQEEGRMWGAQEALHPRPKALSKAP